MFLDSDDYLELNACEECIKILDMGGGGVKLICCVLKLLLPMQKNQ